MCFFDQVIYVCGDFKWGAFRQHCAKEYRTGETCGMKLVMQNIHTHVQCKICEKLEKKYIRKAKEEDRVEHWKSLDANNLKESINAGQDAIEGLNCDISKLMQERRHMQNSLDSCGTEMYKKEEPVLSSYLVSLDATHVSDSIGRPNRYRLGESDKKAVLLGDDLICQKNTLSSTFCTESRLAKRGCNRRSVPSKHTGQAADRTYGLHESRNDNMKTDRDNFSHEAQVETKLGHRAPAIIGIDKLRKVTSSCDKSSKTASGPSETSDDNMASNDFPFATAALQSANLEEGKDLDQSQSQELAYSVHKDRNRHMDASHILPRNARQRSRHSHANRKLGISSLSLRLSMKFQNLPTFQNKAPEILCLPQLSCTEKPTNQDVLNDEFLRSGFKNAENKLTSKEIATPIQYGLNWVHHDTKPRQIEMIEIIILLLEQGVYEYLMREFYVFFDQTWSANLKACPGSPDSSSGSDTTSINPLVDSSTSEDSRGGKKRASGGPDEDKPEEDGKGGSKKPRIGSKGGCTKLACPYFKRDPYKFGIGTPYYLHGCAGQGWPNLGRLKEHLYRAHYSFFQCTRCKTRFRSQASLNEHSEAEESCKSRTRSLEDGFDPETYLYLHSKKKTRKGQSAAEGWKEIFARLFPDRPIPYPYVSLGTGDIQVTATSELDDLENFEAYRQREVPKYFMSRATIEALKFSEPVARHLLGQVPDMVRDSEEVVSRQYQSTLLASDHSLPNPLVFDSLPSQADMALSGQSEFSSLDCPFSDRVFNNALIESRNPQQITGPMETTNFTDLHSFPLVDEFDIGRTTSCFCMGPCTCPSRLPERFPTKNASGDDFSQILQIVQNMSNRIATLEKRYEGYATPLDGFISTSLFRQAPLLHAGVSSGASNDNTRESAALQNAGRHLQDTSSPSSRPLNGTSARANTGNESLDWNLMINMDNSED